MSLKYIQIIVLAGVFGLQFLAEHLYPQKREINDWKNERFNLLVGFVNLALTFIPAGFLVQWIAFTEERNWGVLHQFTLPYWMVLAVTILVMDFWMYVWHRLNHTVPVLWRFHSFHHKDTKMNSTTALRFHTAELFFSYPGKAAVCFLFGIGYTPSLVYEILFFISVIIHHSNIRITKRQDNIYRTLFASPLMHRIHHSVRFDETNSNFGALFSFWDRLMGSWTEKPKQEITFGVPKDPVLPTKT